MVEHSTMYQKYGDTEIVMGENAMKKRALVRLIAIMMILCFSASAEYKDYELTVGDASSALTWSFYPIDAHNVVVYVSVQHQSFIFSTSASMRSTYAGKAKQPL